MVKKRHNEEVNELYCSPNIVIVIKSRKIKSAGHVAHMGENRGVHGVLVGKTEGKKPPGRRRRSWEDNIKMDLQTIGRVFCSLKSQLFVLWYNKESIVSFERGSSGSLYVESSLWKRLWTCRKTDY
jgi:hypothetical protein